MEPYLRARIKLFIEDEKRLLKKNEQHVEDLQKQLDNQLQEIEISKALIEMYTNQLREK